MTRLDIDDLPPKIAAILAAVAEGEEVLLMQGGVVVGRLTGAAKPALSPEPTSEVLPAEIFEQFRSSIEDDF